MILAVTGHRPQKLGGFSPAAGQRLVEFATAELRRFNPLPQRVLTGLALGWDQAIAWACAELGIPFIACVPCKGQDTPWPAASRQAYRTLLALAYDVVAVCPGGYAAWKMIRRDHYMVDQLNCLEGDKLLALYNGDTDGGTAKTVQYAQAKGVAIENCWERWISFST
jgi:uncharacterized phage-like protein YoqJ